MKRINPLLYKLPFDQFSRQFIVSELIEVVVRDKLKNEKLKIIDLGGHKGKTKEFHPKDDVTILDIYDDDYEGYQKGDATNLAFPDKSFDVAVSFDVFEHIPRPKRASFIKEALRVSRRGVIMCMPVDDINSSVSKSEIMLNDFFKSSYGEDHQWLKEHIDYKIPNLTDLRKQLKEIPVNFTEFNSNNLEGWILLQSVNFIAAKNPSLTSEVHEINEWYNRSAQSFDRDPTSHSYRKIMYISDNSSLVEKAKDFNKILSNSPKQQKVELVDVMSKTVPVIAQLVKENRTILEIKDSVKSLEKEVARHTGKLNSIYESGFWRHTRAIRVILRKIQRNR
jgi:hypothetical protein